jgi:uncharacterized protein YyaL (SSP411 family)
LAELWQKQPEQIAGRAKEIARALRDAMGQATSGHDEIDASLLARAAAELVSQFDRAWGGFSGPPKFPDTGALALLFRQYTHTNDRQLLEMAAVTLDTMAAGGIHDQIGGGFHRYTVDGSWLTPHFEKMLYDNAQLAKAYLEGYQITAKPLYRRVATDTLDYVIREMSDRGGGFHSSQDADSEGEEGKYYLWRPEEIDAVLGVEDGRLFGSFYGVSDRGHFEGSNILHVPHEAATFAARWGLSEQQLHERLTPMRARLLAARSRRVAPGKDDKVLAAWNGMMISALAKGYQVLGDDRYLDAAERAADFILQAMFREDVLHRVYRGTDGSENTSKQPGFLDDYAEVGCGLIDLYEADFDGRWLAAAGRFADILLAHFWDTAGGGFFYTSDLSGELLLRTKPFQDGATPSGNATAALLLLRLAKYFDHREYVDKAESLLRGVVEDIQKYPRAHLRLLCAMDFDLDSACEVVIVGRRGGEDTKKLLAIVRQTFLPNRIVALADPDEPRSAEAILALLADKPMVSGQATAYVCRRATCQPPAVDAVTLERALERER